jgi:hypothetical protein
MKKSQLKQLIKEMIISELTMVGSKTDPSEAPSIARTERTGLDTVKDAISQARKTQTSIGVAEISLNEMASFYKVKDKEGFKKALDKYKENRGEKYGKNALDQLLSALEKENEVDIKVLAKQTNKDTATWNNPATRAALEKEDGDFAAYLEAGREKLPKEPKTSTPKEPKEPKASTPKTSTSKEKSNEKEKDERAQTAAKTNKSSVRLQKLEDELTAIEKEMKEIVGKYKQAEGEEKEKLKDALKEKTKAKKELEKAQDRLISLLK